MSIAYLLEVKFKRDAFSVSCDEALTARLKVAETKEKVVYLFKNGLSLSYRLFFLTGPVVIVSN